MLRTPQLLVLCLVLLIRPAWGQQAVPKIGQGAVYEVWQNDTLIAQSEADNQTLQSVLVEFATPPLKAGYVSAKKAHHQAVEDEHLQFERDFQMLVQQAPAKQAERIRLKYRHVFNGVAVQAARPVIDAIRRLPYVSRVVQDGEIHALGREAHTTATSEAVSYENADGAGIVIAIIDTGVDYTHPAFGGTIGADSKVLGGYDFVNDDSDPFDDNGHGTHVASIAAGKDSSITGTAPEAALLAYKVLDEHGSGRDAWVLAAIERAMDPDGNPETDDRVDVMNLSLGGAPGGADNHPITLAIEHATQAGVICVVAAGNGGDAGRATISVPGNAASAITVGAADASGMPASFSAQGPTGSLKNTTLPAFRLKPDILAPGVGIEGAWTGGGYRELDGTSMATPYIAGLAARIKQTHPDWSPAKVKAALMQSAEDKSFPRWHQGAGFVEASASFDALSLVMPSSLSLGMQRGSRQDTIRIYNHHDQVQTYRLLVEGLWPAGVRMRLDETQVAISPGETVSVPLEIFVDPANLSPRTFPENYNGSITVQSDDGFYQIPVSLYRPSLAQVKLDDAADLLVLHGHEQDRTYSFLDTSGDLFLMLPPDTYEVIAQFDDAQYTVIRENVELNDFSAFSLSKADAVHRLTLMPLDRQGDAWPVSSGFYAISHKTAGLLVQRTGERMSLAAPLKAEQYVSSFSDAYRLEMKLGGSGKEGGYYEIPFGLYEGVDGDVTLRNNPDAFITLDYRYNVPESINEALVIPWMQMYGDDAARVFISDGPDRMENERLLTATSMQQTVFLQPPPASDFPWQGFSQTLHPRSMTPTRLLTHAAAETMLSTAPVYVDVNGDVTFGPNGETAFVENGVVEINAGGGLARWAGWLDVSRTSFQLREQPHDAGFFVDHWSTMTAGTFGYSLFEGNTEIYTDSLHHVPQLPVARKTGSKRVGIKAGSYRMVVEGTHRGGKARVELRFQTDLADPSPLRIKQLAIMKDGAFVDRLEAGASHKIFTDLTDTCPWCEPETAWDRIANVNLSIRTSADSTWHSIDLAAEEGRYTGVLQDTLQSGAYDLRLHGVDVSGNELIYLAEGAFEIGAVQQPTLVYPALAAEVTTEAQQLVWKGPPEAHTYHLQVARDALFEQIEIEADALMETQIPLPVLEPGRRYYWRVRVASSGGELPWSAASWFVTFVSKPSTSMPAQFEAFPLYPNPARYYSILRFDLPEAVNVQIKMFDVLGRQVVNVEDKERAQGSYQVSLDLERLNAGVYYVHLQAGLYRAVKKMVVIQ